MIRDFSKNKLSIFASYIRPHRREFALDMQFSALIAVVDLIFPYVSRWTMNSLLPNRAFAAFFTVMGCMLAAYLLRSVFNYLITVIGHGMGMKVETDMRRDVFNHMQELSYSFFDKHRTGVLLARVTNDLFEVVELAHHGPENILICTLTILGAMIVLFLINWRLALVLLILMPVLIGFTLRQRRRMQEANREVKVKVGEINAAIESGISGIRTSKAFANEKEEDAKFDKANEAYRHSRDKYYKAMGLFNGGIEATIGIMQVAVIAVGGYLIMKDQMNYIDLITFTLYISTFTSPVRKLAQFMEIYTTGMAGYDRFLEIMRTRPDIEDEPDAEELSHVRGDIRLEQVSFQYSVGKPVLRDVSLHIAPGETYALVGSSGGGKTTLCHLIPRFYDVHAGRVLVDGKDVRHLTQASLRKNIGIIQQDVFIFAGTVMDNIRYGRPDATDKEVYAAAIKAEIHEDIMQMPEGYGTFVGERGVQLSGGQKQRLSIARVILKDPPILILDEATSALDSVTEVKIQESLERLSEGKTCLVIAHRLSTVRRAHRIGVVEGHRIIEEGSRDELLALGGAYAALEKAQELK